MKTIKFILTTIAVAGLSVSVLAQQREQLTVPLSDPGKPYKLDVSLVMGSIKVLGYEGKDVVVDAQTEGRKEERSSNSGGMRRIGGGDNMEVTANEKNNVVNITSGFPNKPVNLVIKVPPGSTSVKLGTVNDGNITASNISGDLEVSNVNGEIKLTGISGSVVANTVNGSVVVTFKSINTKAAMAFTTLNGDVDVTFPASLKANVKLRSDRGEVFTDFDMATSPSTPKASKNSEKGFYRISIEDWIHGKINGGGQEILMKNMQGNIYIRKAK